MSRPAHHIGAVNRWPPERDAHLLSLYRSHHSTFEIAWAMSTTSNAVLARLGRLRAKGIPVERDPVSYWKVRDVTPIRPDTAVVPAERVKAAVHALRRLQPVYRCKPDGQADFNGVYWRVGRQILTEAELVERAARKAAA